MGDVVCRIGVDALGQAWLYDLYNRIMIFSSEMDKDGYIWKYCDKCKKSEDK